MQFSPTLSEPWKVTEVKKRPRSDYALILISTTFLFIYYRGNPGLAAVLDLSFIMTILWTWVIWNFTAGKITRVVIHGFLPKSKLVRGHVKLVFRVDEVTSPKHHVLFVLRKSFLPLVLVLGVSSTIGSQFSAFLFKVSPLNSLSPADYVTITTAIIALIVWPWISVFVVPIKWLLDSLGLRFLNEKKKTVEPFSISPFWQSLVGVGQ